MPEIKLTGEQFNDVVNSLNTILNEARFKFSPGGLKVIAVDAANVALVKLELSKDYFYSFKKTDDELEEYGIDIKKWKNIRPKKADELWIDFNHKVSEKSDTYSIIMNGNDRWKIKNLDPNTIIRDPNEPVIELHVCHIVESSLINEAITKGSILSDKIKFCSEDGRLTAMCRGDADTYVKYLESECDSKKKVSSLFNIDYMKEIFKFLKNHRKVEIHMAHDHPIRIVKKNFGNDVNSSLEYLLAPRIEAD